MQATRSLNIDVARGIAIIFIFFIHWSNRNHVSIPMGIIHCLTTASIPLFILLIGYCNSTKTVEDYYNKGKWKNGIRVYIAYLILGSISYLSLSLCNNYDISFHDYIYRILNFRLSGYDWFIEMWIGLFFLTPFINVLCNSLSKKEYIYLISTLLLITSLPAFLNRNGNSTLPGFWIDMYPVTIFCIGNYLRKYPVCIPRRYLYAVLSFVVFVEPLLNIFTKEYVFYWGGPNDIIFTISAISIFLIIQSAKLKKKIIAILFSYLSSASLFIYLAAYAFDVILNSYYEAYWEEMDSNGIMCITVFPILSLILSVCASMIYFQFDKKIIRGILQLS